MTRRTQPSRRREEWSGGIYLRHEGGDDDRARELAGVWRRGGGLRELVWGAYERATGYVILTKIATRRCGQAVRAAGVDEPNIELRDGTVAFPSIESFVETEVRGSPLVALLDEESYRGLIREAQRQQKSSSRSASKAAKS
jgi:hypothetical protein